MSKLHPRLEVGDTEDWKPALYSGGRPPG